MPTKPTTAPGTEPFGSTTPGTPVQPSYEDYSQKATSDLPVFFLSRQGQSARMRIGSKPYNYQVQIKESIVDRFAWAVVLKEVNEAGQPLPKRAVVFTSSPVVYDQIRELVQNPKFGDPSNFDIIVTRTQDAKLYYVVRIIESTVRPMSDDDKRILSEANLNVQNIVAQAEAANNVQNVTAPVNDPLAAADFD